MKLHLANHDIQIVIDQYACAQYVCGYLTKNEGGISKLLKAVNEECVNESQLKKINKLSAVLDKHREVSVQEAVYRLLSLPMTKSSVKVKYISTIHPHHRDGLLKGNIESLDANESIFHTSIHQYYEKRPKESKEKNVLYDEEEMKENYWDNLGLSEFVSKYEIVYGKCPKKETEKNRIQTLLDGKGYIRKRNEDAVIRYYLSYDNDEDLARGLLILFLPFRNEMEDIHLQDVGKLLNENKDMIKDKRKKFEKYHLMSDLIDLIQKQNEKRNTNESDDEEDKDEETTAPEDITDFNEWARNQAAKDLSKFKNLTDLPDKIELRQQISLLNKQQRQIFDDFCERVVSQDVNEPPVYLFITGNAGTGKSHLVRLLIEAVKSIKIMPGDDLKKPPLLNMAPTATAAFIIGGKTIDSSLGFTQFTPIDSNQYIPVAQAKLSSLKFQYEEASVLFIDEISMVGSKKLTKINFRLQDLADGENKLKFMGGRSVVAIGDLWQLPPVRDKIILDNNSLDGRPDFAPSHFKENFKIFYLTEKMRNQKDENFSALCDRVGRGKITEEDEIYLKTRIRKSENEGSNEKFKNGEISIIVTTNPKRELLNNQKLDELLPNEKEYLCNSVDRITNLPHGPKLSNRDKDNLSKTGNLPEILRLKVGAPVVITTNNKKAKYREDGMGNGARGYVSAIQVSPENQDKVEIIWVVFKNEKIGRRY